MKKLALAVAIAAFVLTAGVGAVRCTWQDQERVGGTASAWTDSLWTQTTQASFLTGLLWQVDANTSQGDLTLAINAGGASFAKGGTAMPMFGPAPTVTPTPAPTPTATPTGTATPAPTATPTATAVPTAAPIPVYYSAGSLTSAVLDVGTEGAEWDALFWDETLPASTGITFWARASDSAFDLDDDSVAWVAIGATSPATAGLPAGRYKQWRANLTTSDTSQTPVLHEVRLWYH